MNEKTETSSDDVETQESIGQRVDPILEHLDVGDAEVDKALIRKKAPAYPPRHGTPEVN